jgi:carboxypeptidase C (cathepsin A)
MLAYDARWEELILTDSDGAPNATISATSYVVESNGAERPVTFLFNGGPGASSTPLHFSGFGPLLLERGVKGGGSDRLVANPNSLLDVTDLVFIDPVGTGFGRELRAGGLTPYLSVAADAAVTETFIRNWLADYGRIDSPVFLLGESYGGYRLGTMAEHLSDLNIAGLSFLSPSLDLASNEETLGADLPHVFRLPTMAVAAWHHRCASRHVVRADLVFERALRFARSDYLRALFLGFDLPDDERHRIANRVAEFLGLPSEAVLATDLRGKTEDFVRSLLPGSGLVVGRLDTRITGPMPPPPENGRPSEADDPALGIGRSNIVTSDVVAGYLREHAQASVDAEKYISLSLELNFAWDWRSDTPKPAFDRSVVESVTRLLSERPKTRILLLGGYFDLATPLAASSYWLHHCTAARDNLRVVPLSCGHSLDDDVARELAGEAIRQLIASAEAAVSGRYAGERGERSVRQPRKYIPDNR